MTDYNFYCINGDGNLRNGISKFCFGCQMRNYDLAMKKFNRKFTRAHPNYWKEKRKNESNRNT